jgi:hypothetical protein
VKARGPAASTLDEALLADVFHVRGRVERDARGDVSHVVALEPAGRPGGPS